MQYVIGKPGCGKTSFLTRLFLEQLQTAGGAYFDFTGDVSPLLSAIPPLRRDDTVFFNPTDTEFPIGFNILHNATDIPRTANAVVETIKSAWHYEGSTPLLDMYLYTSTASLCYVPNATLLGIPYLLTNAEYRDKVIGQVGDPVLKQFWDDFYRNVPERDRRHDTMSTLNKVFALITDPTIRNIIGQVRTSFKIKDTSIIIASFPPELGREKVSFLATLLLHALPDFFIVLDDGFHLGSRAVTEKTNIVFSHQYLGQLTQSMQETLIGTADSMIAFRIGPTDNLRLEREFDLNRNVSTLTDLPPFTYHKKARTVTHDNYSIPHEYPLHDPKKLINNSRERFCSHKAHVETKINKFIENT